MITLLVVSLCVFFVPDSVSSLQIANYRKHALPGGATGFLPRMRNGRNSKVMKQTPRKIVDEEEDIKARDVSALLADLKQQLAQVTGDSFDEKEVEIETVKQKERLPKENTNNYNIEQHSFNVADDAPKSKPAVPSSPIINIQPNQQNQPQQQFYNQQQQQGFPQQQQYNQQQVQNNQQQQVANNQQQQYFNQQQQFSNNGQYQQQQFSQQAQQQPQTGQPRQIVQGRGESAALFNQFGDAMGPDANVDPERNKYPNQPQIIPRQQEEKKEDEVRCINKVMQVEETVYEEKVKCQHTFSEKCHDTFITDYVPTQEKKCETSFAKNCHITYKPMMFEEDVEVCNEPLKKVCNNETVGQGETVCNTHYETVCETRYKEHEVEQDEPVCEMVVEKKCKAVTIPVPGQLLRRRRQIAGEEPSNPLELTQGNLGPLDDGGDLENVVNIGEECEEWPVQKCELQKKVVKKTNPNTACEKIPKEICAPSGCVIQPSKKACRTETRALLQNIPSEECDLEPQENCKMETVLVPRLVQQPNCIKVPKEVCVNERVNPKKVKRPVVKEWCYKPSDLTSPTSRLALSQFFNKN